MKNRPLIILALVAFAICVGAIWFLQLEPAVPAQPISVPAVPAQAPVAAPAVVKSAEPAKPVAVAPVAPKVEKKEPPRPLAEWEMKIEQLLSANIPETETAQLLINLMPTLPPEGQAEAAQHISNLLPDKDYNRALPLIKNTKLPEEVLDVLVTDLMNRDDAVKLPTLLEIAKLPGHPHQEEAITDLQIFLDVDNGTDWNKWKGAMDKYLKTQAAENAAELPAPGAPKAK